MISRLPQECFPAGCRWGGRALQINELDPINLAALANLQGKPNEVGQMCASVCTPATGLCPPELGPRHQERQACWLPLGSPAEFAHGNGHQEPPSWPLELAKVKGNRR